MSIVEEGLARLEEYRTSNRLIRHRWVDFGDGQEVACLLAALSPEVGHRKSPSACPAELLDPWFAYLTPWFDDCSSTKAWPGMVARYGGVVRKLMSLPPERRYQIEYGARAIIVREATRNTGNADVLEVCKEAALLCEKVASGAFRDDAAFIEVEMTARKASSTVRSIGSAMAADVAVAVMGPAAEGVMLAAQAAADRLGATNDRITAKIFDLIDAS